jgi:hypothetical protein
MSAHLVTSLFALGAATVVATTSCTVFDPCARLAERICACELTESARQSCREERINAGDNPVATESEVETCVDGLNTCTCEALDANHTEMCGFTRDGYAPDNTSTDGDTTDDDDEAIG